MIKPDNWIRAQCETPTHIVLKSTGGVEYGSEPFTATQRQYAQHSKILSKIVSDIDSIEDRVSFINSYSVIREITENELANWKPMITPFTNSSVKTIDGNGIVSYGLSSMGYDVRLQNKFKIFTNTNNSLIDPVDMPVDCYVDIVRDYVIIPPNSYALGCTEEYFNIPNDVMVVCLGKSTYARAGILINVTPIEPGFSGNIVIEISNCTNLPVKVHANQGIAQFLFLQSDEPCSISYKDKNGKYQNQTGITLAKV